MTKHPHPMLMVSSAGAAFLLAFMVSPWFFVLVALFLAVWALGFAGWLFS